MATGRQEDIREGVFSARSRNSDVVADAVLLATAAVRIAVKNLLIVRALRDGADYEEGWWLGAVAREFELIAAENEADAARLEDVHAGAKRRHGRAQHPADFRARDRPVLKRRMRVLRKIAARLRELAADEAALLAIVAEARQTALEEITSARHDPSSRAARDPGERAAGLVLLSADLEELARSTESRSSSS